MKVVNWLIAVGVVVLLLWAISVGFDLAGKI